jgi:peptidoglycan/xylan/chitin deacetylase (PgdA/CDA1 family)
VQQLLGMVRRWRRRGPRPLILMYHRVAEPRIDPWGLAVRPRHFEQHLAILRRSRCVLSMRELVQRLERRTLPANAVAVTFDDGYADTLQEARPRLAATSSPATLFLTTGAVGQRTEYWWDELARLILLHQGPVDQDVAVAGERCRLSFSESPANNRWRAWQEAPTAREAAYVGLWRKLRDLSEGGRQVVMTQLRASLTAPAVEPKDLPMTAQELAALAADGLFELGGHTVTHPALPTLDPTQRRHEILQGKLACERITGRPIAGFAYPHGALDQESRALVEGCGFAWACSTEPSPVRRRRYDRYALPRICVRDWDGDGFEKALQAACA